MMIFRSVGFPRTDTVEMNMEVLMLIITLYFTEAPPTRNQAEGKKHVFLQMGNWPVQGGDPDTQGWSNVQATK